MRAHFLPVLYCFLVVMLTAQDARSEAPFTVIKDGKPQATIYVEGPIYGRELVETAMKRPLGRKVIRIKLDGKRIKVKADDIYRSAIVLDLNYHFRRMAGTELPVVATSDVDSIAKPAIVLGRLANKLGGKPESKSPSGETFRIRIADGRLLIGGESDLAVRHGAYEVLRSLDADWVMPGPIGEIIPRRKTVVFAKADITQAPDFQFRRLWYRGYKPGLPEEQIRFRWWQWRHKGGHVENPVMNIRGHEWPRFIKRNRDAFKADPTMLALVRRSDGKFVRQGPQIETTHPRVIELFADEIRRKYKKNIASGTWTKDTAAGFAIGPADGLNYSVSPESLAESSLAVDPVLGELDRTDNLIRMANRILKQVTEDYPNAHVGSYSYSVHSQYPARYTPHPNVVQEFAPIGFSRFHSALDPVSKTQSSYLRTVRQWGKLSRKQGNILSYRGYNWNLAENLLPYIKVHIWGDELPFYHRQGFIGLNVEATKQWSVLAPSDYVFMRLAWNTEQDWQDLLEEFCRHAYGKAANPMLRYWHRLIDVQRNAGMEAGSYHAFPLIFDETWLTAAETDLKEAAAMADTKADRTRIRYVRIGVDALRLYLDYHAATLKFDFAEAERLQGEILSAWQAAYDENTDLVANEAPRYWKRFVEPFVEQANKYTSSPYRMLAPLPDELATAFDPVGVGERLNLHRPEINDRRFIKTRTISSTWDAQGLGGLRSGAVWYRWRFQIPHQAHGKPVGLFIGGVEDEARVWINGQYVGSSGLAFSKPLAFDLTSGLANHDEHLLAIQVIRNSSANELGLGGILRPSFLFTGPQLERAAPQIDDNNRILPGGEIEEK